MGHFNKALSVWGIPKKRHILGEMGNKSEALGVGRNFRGHPVQSFALALYNVSLWHIIQFSSSKVLGGEFWSFH